MATLRTESRVAAGTARYPALSTQQSRPGSGGQYSTETPKPQERGSITQGATLPSSGGGMSGDSVYSASQMPVQTGQTSTSYREFQGSAPTPGALPEYAAPEEWSGERRAGEIQKSAALGIREARRSLTEATAGLGNDPASAYALRQALAQHGINIEGTLAGARAETYQKEQSDIALRTHTADVEYQARINDRNLRYEAAMNKWLNTAKDISTTSASYTPYGDLTGGGGAAKAGAGTTVSSGGGRSSGVNPIARTSAEAFRDQIIREAGLLGA